MDESTLDKNNDDAQEPRIIRGSYLIYDADFLQSSFRDYNASPDLEGIDFAFRVARKP